MDRIKMDKSKVKLDNRIRTLIENGANTGHRSLFVIVGEKSRDQAVTLYKIWKDLQVKAKPSVLWCYKKDLGFSTHRKKRMKEMQKLQSAGLDAGNDTLLNDFILTTNVRWCYYHETHNILGQTFSMVVLQDFEAIQPNILARTIETVEGGGLAVILLNTLHSLKQLYTMTMDVHARYRTESHQDVVSRFNERFILSLIDCKNGCIIDDRFNVLPICANILNIKPLPKINVAQHDPKLAALRESLGDREPIRSLIALCRTHDQANAVIKFTETLAKKTSRATVSLTAARGRGKSAALGLSIASAIAFGYSNIYVTSPSPENLHTLFEFVVNGLKAVHLAENSDFTVVKSSNPEHGDSVVRVNVYKDHNQIIQYIDPIEASQGKLAIQMSNLFVIDEAAAIPQPIVKSFLSSQLVFLSSTVNGYEGTGRSLSLKLLNQLRQNVANAKNLDQIVGSRLIHELTLEEPIRYKAGDPVEAWLTGLLCLDATISELPWTAGCPVPSDCQLYYINRDTLFSYHKTSEAFLHQLMALYVASHYKNTPNDLQMISDAPAHHLFCLLPPGKKTGGKLPEVLCFVQVCLEGEISKDAILNSLARGKRAAGDLIPWTISRQFNDSNFPSLSGARIVRIATNPNYQKMGYGTRALQLIYDYYSGMFDINLSEDSRQVASEMDRQVDDQDGDDLKPRNNLPPLLMALDERKAEKLDYLGVSYGLTPELLKFWKRNKFVPVYVRQTASDITGEHSCIMLRRTVPPQVVDNESMVVDGEIAGGDANDDKEDWLKSFFDEFRTDFIELLVHQFRHFSPQLGLSIIRTLRTRGTDCNKIDLTRQELYKFFLTSRKLAILELYSKSLIDYHQIMPLMFRLSKLYFMDWLPASVDLSAVQATILLSMGVQGKTVNDTANELGLEPTQLLGLFNRAVKKIETYLRSLEEASIEKEMAEEEEVGQVIAVAKVPQLEPIKVSLAHELDKAAKKIERKQKKLKKKLRNRPDKS